MTRPPEPLRPLPPDYRYGDRHCWWCGDWVEVAWWHSLFRHSPRLLRDCTFEEKLSFYRRLKRSDLRNAR